MSNEELVEEYFADINNVKIYFNLKNQRDDDIIKK